MYQVVGYHRPSSLAEALQLVAVGDRVPLGGGVHLHHDGGAVATDVVDLQASGLDALDISATSARLGAMVRLHTVAEDQRLPELIANTARAEQPSTLRTLATIGGTIAAASGDSFRGSAPESAASSSSRLGEIVSRSHPARAVIWPALRKEAPITIVSIPFDL